MSNQGHAATRTAPGHGRGPARPGADELRHFAVNVRRARVATLIQRDGLGHGQQARLARVLGVSATTISRDVAALLTLVAPCPYCGSYPLLTGPLLDRAPATEGGRDPSAPPPHRPGPL
jgi:hypothetical protein